MPPYLPPVSLYMSLTVRVDISVNGFPLRPPVSFLCSLFKVSGLATVVFVTMMPSTPPWKQAQIINILDKVEQNNLLISDLPVTNNLIICQSQRLRNIIDLPDSGKLQYFAITEFNNCLVIQLPSLLQPREVFFTWEHGLNYAWAENNTEMAKRITIYL